jgi:hypothetical protein
MIPGFVTYQTFIALKNHFTLPSYDYMKYQGKVNVKVATYVKRKDRFFFEKLGRMVTDQPELVHYITGNLVHGSNGLQIDPGKVWIGDLTTNNARDRALQFMARQQSLDYCIKKDLTTIKEYIKVRDECASEEEKPPVAVGSFPLLLSLYYEGKILPDTLVALNSFQNLYGYWDVKLKGDPIWEKTKNFLGKYQRLVHPNLDSRQYKSLYTKVFFEEKNTI